MTTSNAVTIIRNKPYYKGVTIDYESPLQATKLVYSPGTTVDAGEVDLDPDTECGVGVNFCSTIADALRWGPVVVEITIPSGVNVIDTGDKLRAERVLVGEVADLSGADLSGADLRGAYLSGADLRGAYLRGADLSGADLRGADLRGADLRRVDLRGADLSGADLSGADLRGAYLSGADLSGADLSGADLRGAYLRGADLSGADLRGADLRGAQVDSYTKLPLGYKIDRSGWIVKKK